MTALLATSVIIDLAQYASILPDETSISAVSLAELAVGTQLDESGQRSGYLATVMALFDPIPYGPREALMYGRLVGVLGRSGRLERSRQLDLMIAATAAEHNLPLYTASAKDLKGLREVVQIVDLS